MEILPRRLLVKCVGTLERGFLTLSTFCVLLIAVVVLSTIVSRYALPTNLVPDDILIVQDLMMASVILPIALVTATREHIAVEVIARWFPGGVRSLLTVLADICGLLFALALLVGAMDAASGKWIAGSTYDSDLGIPEWPGRFVMVAALALLCLRQLTLSVRGVARLFVKD